MGDQVLLHRLPVDQFELQSCPIGAPEYRCDTIRRVAVARSILLLRLLDLAGATVLTWRVYALFPAPPGGDWPQFATLLCVSLAVWLIAGHLTRLYDPQLAGAGGALTMRALVTGVLAFGPMFVVAAIGAVKPIVAPIALAILACGFLSFVMTARLAWLAFVWSALRRGDCLDRALVLAGSMSSARALSAQIERLTQGKTRAAASAPMPGMPDSPSFAWVEDAVRRGTVDRVVITECEEAAALSQCLVFELLQSKLDVTFIPRRPISIAARSQFPAALPGLTFADVTDSALSHGQNACKRGIDIIIAASSMTLMAPALLAIGLAIKLDSPGPVIFRQRRAGLRGTEFSVLKFRTMHHHLRDHEARNQTSRNDHRVTRVGRLLRRTSLDELPQLVNVLVGQMSIVGPRPHACGMTVGGEALTDLAGGYAARHRVRPGITGWAQVNGSRGEVDSARKLRRRIALDCYYIENWSLWLDMKIMVRTVVLLLFDRHAY